MKIVITGAAGRIGRAVHARLAPRHELVGLDRVPAPTVRVVCDLLDAVAVRAALVGADAVIHTAGLHALDVGRESDAEFRRVNVEGTRALAGLAIAVGVSRFILTSTTALYGAAVPPPGAGLAGWIDEHTVPKPRSIYHETKLQAEQLLQSYGHAGALVVTILRMSRCFPEPASRMATYRLHRGIDARDVASAHERAVEMFTTAGARLFLISATTPFLPEDCEALARDAPAVLQRRAPALVQAFARRAWLLPRIIDRVYDSGQAVRALRWRPEYGYDEVLASLDAQSDDVLPPDPLSRDAE